MGNKHVKDTDVHRMETALRDLLAEYPQLFRENESLRQDLWSLCRVLKEARDRWGMLSASEKTSMNVRMQYALDRVRYNIVELDGKDAGVQWKRGNENEKSN